MQPVFDFLTKFTDVSEDEMRAMMLIAHTSSHGKMEILYSQGSIPKRLGLIVKGAVRIYYTDESGIEHTTSLIFENLPFVPFDSFAQKIPVPLTAITLEPTEILWTSHEEFFSFLDAFPKYEKVLRHILSDILRLQGEHIKLLRISSPRERYELFCQLRPQVVNRVPLKYIASYLDMAVETLSRVRAGKV